MAKKPPEKYRPKLNSSRYFARSLQTLVSTMPRFVALRLLLYGAFQSSPVVVEPFERSHPVRHNGEMPDLRDFPEIFRHLKQRGIKRLPGNFGHLHFVRK